MFITKKKLNQLLEERERATMKEAQERMERERNYRSQDDMENRMRKELAEIRQRVNCIDHLDDLAHPECVPAGIRFRY